MSRTALLLAISSLALVAAGAGQTPSPAPAADATPGTLVAQWVERLNALSDAPDTLDRFAALYADDALHIAGPTPDQRGTATYRGHAGIRVWASRIAAREGQRVYRLETETARETTARRSARSEAGRDASFSVVTVNCTASSRSSCP